MVVTAPEERVSAAARQKWTLLPECYNFFSWPFYTNHMTYRNVEYKHKLVQDLEHSFLVRLVNPVLSPTTHRRYDI